jgi:hypothetical protein
MKNSYEIALQANKSIVVGQQQKMNQIGIIANKIWVFLEQAEQDCRC